MTKTDIIRQALRAPSRSPVDPDARGESSAQPALSCVPVTPRGGSRSPAVFNFSRPERGRFVGPRLRQRLMKRRRQQAADSVLGAVPPVPTPPVSAVADSELARSHEGLRRAPEPSRPMCRGAGVSLREELIVPSLEARDKVAALHELSCHLCQCAGDMGATQQDVLAALLKREQLGSTGVGEGVAIPHARISGLRVPVACFARAPDGVPFDAIDAQPVHFIFALLVPEDAAAAHVRALACISRILMDGAFRQRLHAHATRAAIYQDFLEAGFADQWNAVEG